MTSLRPSPPRLVPAALLSGALLASSLAGCASDPLLVTGQVDVAVDPSTSLLVDFPAATRLVRSPVAVDSRVAGECRVQDDYFAVSISRDQGSAGLRSLHISTDEASVDIGGVVYTGLEQDAGCLIDLRAVAPDQGTLTVDVDCLLDDGTGESVAAVGTLSFEGCNQ